MLGRDRKKPSAKRHLKPGCHLAGILNSLHLEQFLAIIEMRVFVYGADQKKYMLTFDWHVRKMYLCYFPLVNFCHLECKQYVDSFSQPQHQIIFYPQINKFYWRAINPKPFILALFPKAVSQFQEIYGHWETKFTLVFQTFAKIRKQLCVLRWNKSGICLYRCVMASDDAMGVFT